MNRRIERINALLRQEVSNILATQVKDHRLSSLVSITHVKTSSDLNSARVYVSVHGDQSTKKTTLRGLKSATHFIRRKIRNQMSIRTVPSIYFYLDESLELGDEVLKLLADSTTNTNTPSES